VTLDGKTYVAGQGNNAYIFPGVGLGVVASGAQRVTDEMFFAAARALADPVSEEDLAQGRIYRPIGSIGQVSAMIAVAVAEVAYRRGLTTQPKPDNLLAHIEAQMYVPCYESYI
jgi:malate dehydrogenase (oxaloacetate-decarboxylating)(NADP+)